MTLPISEPGLAAAPSLEIAHVLFMDIVGYSKLPMDQQRSLSGELQDAVRNTEAFASAQRTEKLVSLPTGDGMALVFFGDPEFPVRCAMQLSRALREHPEIKLRMGIHTGPVYRVADINAASNIAGGGINMAQRVMDCGDAGHILVSHAVADVLAQLRAWGTVLQDLSETEVKHGVHIHIYNLCTDEVGNAELPSKWQKLQREAESAVRAKAKRRKLSLALVAAGMVVAVVMGGFLYSRRSQKLTAKDTIILGDFANSTGDAVFDDTLKQALAIQLEQSPFLNVLSDRKVISTLKLMNRPANERLTQEVAREVCLRTNSKAMLMGSIAAVGDRYLIVVKAENCQSGRHASQRRGHRGEPEQGSGCIGGGGQPVAYQARRVAGVGAEVRRSPRSRRLHLRWKPYRLTARVREFAMLAWEILIPTSNAPWNSIQILPSPTLPWEPTTIISARPAWPPRISKKRTNFATGSASESGSTSRQPTIETSLENWTRPFRPTRNGTRATPGTLWYTIISVTYF